MRKEGLDSDVTTYDYIICIGVGKDIVVKS